MNKPRIYVHRSAEWYDLYMNDANEKLLYSFADVVNERGRMEPMSPEELIERMRGTEAILSLNGVCAKEITYDVLKSVGSVKIIVISHWWGQFKDLDTKKLGIKVIEGSNATTIAVAEWVITCALMGVRKLTVFCEKMRSGSLWCEPRETAGMLYGKKVGLIGLGRIGRYAAKYFAQMGAHVSVFDKYVTCKEIEAMGYKYCSLEDAMANSDIISLHLPAVDETRKMIGAKHFSLIRDGAIFINSARAAIYDEEALIEELKKNRFEAYIDVFSIEPIGLDNHFRNMKNVFITPHISGYNIDMFHYCGHQAIMALKNYFEKGEIKDMKFVFP